MIKRILFSFIALVCGCVGVMADTDLEATTNVLYFKPTTVQPGTVATLRVSLKNSGPVQAIGSDFYLPDGITLGEDEDGLHGDVIKGRTNSRVHNLAMNFNKKVGVYRLAFISYSGKFIEGNDDELFTMLLNVDENMKPGNYTMKFAETELSNTQGILSNHAVFEGTIIVADPTGVTEVIDDADNGIEDIYTVDGVKTEKLQKGFNLIKKKDGKVIKIAK